MEGSVRAEFINAALEKLPRFFVVFFFSSPLPSLAGATMMPPTAQSTCQMLRKVSKQHIEVLTLIMSCVCFVQVRVVAKFESCAFGAFSITRFPTSAPSETQMETDTTAHLVFVCQAHSANFGFQFRTGDGS